MPAEIEQVGRDAVRLQRFGRRSATMPGKSSSALISVLLLGQSRARSRSTPSPMTAVAIDLADAEDPAHARVRHLDVVDRILLRLRAREVDVEDELRVALPHQEEVPHRVTPDFVDEVAHRDVAARALRDLHLFAAAHHGHHLVQHVLRVALRHPHVERLQSGAHARHRAVVVGALHVDRARESALPFGDVIGDVGHEVRGRAAFSALRITTRSLSSPKSVVRSQSAPSFSYVCPAALAAASSSPRPCRRCRATTRGSRRRT